MNEFILNNLNLYIWAKDKNFRYLYCNENYAEAAGLDSPSQIIGKSDDKMPWCSQADFFREGDKAVLDGGTRINVPEVEIMAGRVADILVSENQLIDKNGNTLGIVGSYIDITGQSLEKKHGFFNPDDNQYYLGDIFDNEHLTWREIEVFKLVLLGYTAKQASGKLALSPKTVESHIDNIKRKLQATTKGDLIATAIHFGLTQILHLKCRNKT